MHMPSKWSIGNVEIANRFVVAPMAGVSNPAFRTICKEFRPGLIYTEMVSDKALFYHNKKTLDMTAVEPNEHPLAMQIFGHDIDTMVYAAKFLDESCDCDIIDVNMGCPVNKVIKANAGSSLMLEEAHAVELMQAIVKTVHKPVTVKMRIGFDSHHKNCVALAKQLEQVGVAAIALHARTRAQMYEGNADWSYIKEMKEALRIPVIGNGDVKTPEDAKRMIEETGCDAVMLGRGVLGDPWLISQCVDYLETDSYASQPPLAERFAIARKHAQRLCALKGEAVGMREMRSHAAWYVKGLHNSHALKLSLTALTTYEQLDQCLFDYEQSEASAVRK